MAGRKPKRGEVALPAAAAAIPDKRGKMPVDFAARLASGQSAASIARELGVSTNTANTWAASDGVRAELVELRTAALAEARRELMSLVPLAMQTLRTAMTDPTDKTLPSAVKAATTVVGMAGAAEPERIDLTVRQAVGLAAMSDAELASIAARGDKPTG